MSLVPRFVYGDLDLTDYPYALAFGGDVGAPENAYELLSSLLGDGEIVSSRRSSNRVLSFTVLVEGADQFELAEAEAALVEECDRQANAVTLDPGDGVGPATVFESFRAQATLVRDDDGEQAMLRRYALSIPALPFGRSVDLLTDDAASAPSSAGTVLDACESTTGWGTYNYTATAAAVDAATFHEGAGSIAKDPGIYDLQAVDSYGTDYAYALNADELTGLALSTSTGGYMSVWIKTDWTSTIIDNFGQQASSGLDMLRVKYASGYGAGGGSGDDMEVSFTPAEVAADGFVRYVFQVPAGESITRLRFFVRQYRWGRATVVPKVRYDAISLATTATTDNQIVKTFTVEGSVRAPGLLHVAAPSDSVALGSVLVATVHEDAVMAGYRIDMRRHVTAGATTVDATALHGSYYTSAAYSSATQFEAPATQFKPGNYYAVVLMKASGATLHTFGVETQLTFAGVATGGASSSEASFTPAAAGWMFAPVGTVRIPAVTNAGSDAEIRIRVKGGNFDEVYLIPEAADFTIAQCGTGTVSASGASSHFWIDSPSTGQPSGAWWRGPEADGENRRQLSLATDLTKPGLHSFTPGTMLCFLTTTDADGPTVSLSYHPHWHTNAAL